MIWRTACEREEVALASVAEVRRLVLPVLRKERGVSPGFIEVGGTDGPFSTRCFDQAHSPQQAHDLITTPGTLLS